MKQIMKKSLSLLLSVLVLISMFAVPAAATESLVIESGTTHSDTTWYESDKNEFIISSGAELAGLASIVNQGIDDFSGKTVSLSDDVDISEFSPWSPIGTLKVEVTTDGESVRTNATGLKGFAGTFDGNGKTISGLSASDVEANGVALFGYSTGVIRNFTIEGAISGANYVAGVAAYAEGEFSGITNKVKVTAPGNCVGGIVASASGNINFRDCHNKADLASGVTSASKSVGRRGGIIGVIEVIDENKIDIRGAIKECSNTGNLTGYQYTGGIIGGCFGNVTIDACYNSGALRNYSWGKTYLGGIAGKLENGSISNCYNVGNLSQTPWGKGHLRAVAGIVGLEEGHPVGTAVSNCYNAGTITGDTQHMVEGSNGIYAYGNISGGNQPTGINSMSYDNCVYLEGALPLQDEDHPDYRFWSNNFKNNKYAYDTEDIIPKTEAELKDESVIEILGSNYKMPAEGGYPILYWQTGAPAPTPGEYPVTSTISGGTATVSVAATATAGATVSVEISDVESGKQIKSVVVTDSSGSSLAVKEDNGIYTFTMPSRTVKIAVTLENSVDEEAESYMVKLPEKLDAIWKISADSTHYNAETGKAVAGSTVTIVVEKVQKAVTTSFNGISAVAGETKLEVTAQNEKTFGGAKWYGEYSFTMPDGEVKISLDETYSDIEVYTKVNKVADLKSTYTRSQMLDFAAENEVAYFSGWSTETVPFIGKAESYVTLEQILDASGIEFEKGDKVTVAAPDGFSQTFTYEELIETPRYYYKDIFANGKDSSDKETFAPILTIETNLANSQSELDTIDCDTLNTYRFVYGQTEEQLKNAVKIVDYMPQCVTTVIVEKGNTGNTDITELLKDMNLTSTDWDGKSVDVSWYIENPDSREFKISTAAEFAGVAALVNGLVNENCKVYTGDAVYTASQWAASDYVKRTTGEVDDSSNNQETINYAVGITTFDNVTIKLVKDFDMSKGNYMPIGGSYLMTDEDSSTKVSGSFYGTLDGGGHNVTVECDRHCESAYGDGANIGLIGRLGAHDGDTLPVGTLSVSNVAIYGNIKGNRSVGGVVGKIGMTSSAVTIEGCANFAAVTGTDAKGTGGIVGAGWTYIVEGTVIKNCYNAGTIYNSHNAFGGIVGSNEIKIVNCYNVGTVDGLGDAPAIASDNGGGSYENCYWLEGTADMGVYKSGKDLLGVNAKKTSKEMKSEDFLTLLGDAFKAGSDDVNQGYPVLYWQIAVDASIEVSIENKAGNDAVIIKDGEWKAGENEFFVKSPKACVVIIESTDADGNVTYNKLKASSANETDKYKFSTPDTFAEGDKIRIYLNGDANGDGYIDTMDTTRIRRTVAGGFEKNILDEIGRLCSDANGDGYVDTMDTTRISRYIAGGFEKNSTIMWV